MNNHPSQRFDNSYYDLFLTICTMVSCLESRSNGPTFSSVYLWLHIRVADRSQCSTSDHVLTTMMMLASICHGCCVSATSISKYPMDNTPFHAMEGNSVISKAHSRLHISHDLALTLLQELIFGASYASPADFAVTPFSKLGCILLAEL